MATKKRNVTLGCINLSTVLRLSEVMVPQSSALVSLNIVSIIEGLRVEVGYPSIGNVIVVDSLLWQGVGLNDRSLPTLCFYEKPKSQRKHSKGRSSYLIHQCTEVCLCQL